MRHQKAGRKFNRTSAHRQVMFSNMAASLFKHEVIRTTLPKVKELRRVAEPLITLARPTAWQTAASPSRLRDKGSGGHPVHHPGPRYSQRPGGYHAHPQKCGFRAGDNAPMAYVELVDRPQAASNRDRQRYVEGPGLPGFFVCARAR